MVAQIVNRYRIRLKIISVLPIIIIEGKMRKENKMTEQKKIRVAQITKQYGAELCWARRPTDEESAGYADWYRPLALLGCGDERIEVPESAIRQVIAGRKRDGIFPGCSNVAWTITEKEEQQILALAREIAADEAARADAAPKEIENRDGLCPICHTYCCGDCTADGGVGMDRR